MWKSILGTHDGSSVSSSSKRERRRDDEESTTSRTRARANSNETSSSSRRKSSRRDDSRQTSGLNPTSTSFSSSSRAPYAGVAGPSVASSYDTAYTDEPTNVPIQPPELIRNESMADKVSRSEGKESKRGSSKRNSRTDLSGRARGVDNSDEERENAERDSESKRRRDSRKSSKGSSTPSRAAEDHKNSLVENQFPGQEPDTYTEAYRPPGLASDYYGDHGESVAYQPGVRPNPPDIIQTADQAHLWEPLAEAKPPPEPSSLGQAGAASSYFGTGSMSSDDEGNAASTTPSKVESRPNLKPAKHSQTGASPRSSPRPEGRKPRRSGISSSDYGMIGASAVAAAAGMGAAAMASRPDGRIPSSSNNSGERIPSKNGGRPQMSTNTSGNIGAMGSGSMTAGVGAAADYYTGDIRITTGSTQPPAGQNHQQTSNSQSYQRIETTQTNSSSRPTQQSSNSNALPYGAAAAAVGLAGAAYLAHEHHESEHQQASTSYQGQSSNAQFDLGQGQSAFPQMQQQYRHRHRGPFGKVIEWFQDPAGVAEFEAYSEATGLCKYCFDPNSSPKDAPRKHHYRSRRYSGGRYGSSTRMDKMNGSSTRVDKIVRYSSDEERRRKKSYSTAEKVAAGGLAAVGAGLVGEAIYKQKNDFDDTYSVKSGRPSNGSKISFQEQEDERHSVSRRKRRESEDVRLSRRNSDRRRQSASGGEVFYEKRSSRRRDSSGSDNRTGDTSRGAALSTAGIAAIGAAGVAAVATDSRRRSRSPKKRNGKYYSKRVSPRHSYVDLTTAQEVGGGGPFGLGGFFSSPSANERRKKKTKGMFNFNNGSSSSSDADLAFGEGTVKRKDGRKGKEKRDDTAAILGLAATGAALVAESERRGDRKGKRRETADNRDSGRDSGRDSRLRRTSNKIKLQEGYVDSADNGDEGVWEDATDDDADSVDTALAYGGRISTKQSRESLNDGTSKWDWRWGSKQQNEEKKARRKSSKVDLSGYDEVAAGLVGGVVGTAAAAVALPYSYGSTSSLPPMQYMDPIPADANPRIGNGVSPQSSGIPPPMTTRTSGSIPLVAPQPMTPISQQMYQPYADVPSGPPVFDKYNTKDRRADSPDPIPANTDHSMRDVTPRDNSPPLVAAAVLPSRKETVQFNLTDEQIELERERERKARNREQRKKDKQSAARDVRPVASIITGPERSPERRLETWRLRDAVKANPPDRPEPKEEPRRTSVDERGDRISEIDRQLQELYEEHARSEAKKKNKGNEVADGVTAAAAAIAVGASVMAVKSLKSRSESEDEPPKKPKRKSSLKKSRSRDASSPPEDVVLPEESSTEKIARMAAQRVRSNPSPVHEDYGSFFVPEELAGNVKQHNAQADQRDLDEKRQAQIIDIVPRGERKEWYEPTLYHPYGTEDTDLPPTQLPWKVPHLDLVSPTPPPGVGTRGDKDEDLPVSGRRGRQEEKDEKPEYERERVRSGSKVTWGDHEINVYEVVTPEYERDGHEFTTPAATPASKTDSPPKPTSPLREVTVVNELQQEQAIPPVEDMTKEQQEHVAMGKDFADLPPSSSGTAKEDISPIPIIEDRVPSSVKKSHGHDLEFAAALAAGAAATGSGPKNVTEEPSYYTRKEPYKMKEGSTSDDQQSFYQSPFAETVSDLGITGDYSKSVPAIGQGFVEGKELPVTPKGEVSFNRSAERPSKSERAEAAEAVVVPGSVKNLDQQPNIPDGFNVFDYMEDADGQSLPSASILGAGTSSALSGTTARDLPAEEEFTKPKRAETFDEEAFVESFATPNSKTSYNSDPEQWEREGMEVVQKEDRRTKEGEADLYAGSSRKKPKKSKHDGELDGSVTSSPAELRSDKKEKKRRSSKRDSEIFDDDAKSVASDPSTEKRKSSKRDSQVFDDDTKSVASETATSREGKRKSKDDKEKKSSLSGWGLVAGALFSSSRSDVSSKSEKRKSKSSDSDKKRRKSKDRGDVDDDTASEPRKSRSDSVSSSFKVSEPRDQSVDDSFVSADEEAGPNGHSTRDMEVDEATTSAFLAKRPEMPTGSDGASGLKPESIVGNLEDHDQTPVAETHTNARELVEPNSAEILSTAEAGSGPYYFPSEPQLRHLSNLRTTDLASSPISSGSPTAVPIRFGRLPISPGAVRPGSVGSPIATVGSPSSPLTTPRTRQGRPASTEFRSSKEFRPLYLVERHSYARQPTPEEEEQYPSLPSSRTSSAHPSMENLRGQAADDLDIDLTPQHFARERQRRYSTSYWGDNNRATSPDFLDSGMTTPVQANFPEKLKKEMKQKPKYEFHSPSELLQDPGRRPDVPIEEPSYTSPLPSVVGTEKSSSRSISPLEEERSESRENLGLGTAAGLAGGAVVLAANQVIENKREESKRRASNAEEPVAREVKVSEQTADAQVDFELQPVSSKKSKKDKKKNRKALEFADDFEATDPRDVQVLPTLLAAQEIEDAAPQDNQREIEALTPVTDIEKDLPTVDDQASLQELAQEHEWAVLTKKSKKDKKKDKKGKWKDSQPLLSTIETTPAEERGGHQLDLEEPMTAVNTSDNLVLPAVAAGAAALAGTGTFQESSRDVSIAPATGMDETDRTVYLDEKTSHEEYPFPEARLDDTDLELTRAETYVPSSREIPQLDLSLTRTLSYVPSLHEIHQLSAFEAAFERAIQARGLPEGVTRDDAMDVFLPKRENAPFVEKGVLTPIGEIQSAVPSPEKAATPTEADQGETLLETPAEQVEEPVQGDAWVAPSTSKKDKKKKKKSLVVFEDPDSELTSAPTTSEVAEQFEPTTAKDIEQAGVETPFETPSEQFEEFTFAPTSSKKSKKNKKGKRGTAAFDDSETPETGTHTPGDETRDLRPLAEGQVETQKSLAPTDPVEPAEEATYDTAWAPSKKSKKEKKSKRKSLAVDDMEYSDAPTPASEPDDTENGNSSDLVAASTAGLAAGALAGLTATSVLQEPSEKAEKKQHENEMAWAPTPTKKGKKDKTKCKKGTSFSLNDAEESTATTMTPDPEILAAAENRSGTLEESATVGEAGRHTRFAEKLSDEPELSQDTERAREANVDEDAWATPSSSKKKDKKGKKKRQSLAAFEEEQAQQPSEGVSPEPRFASEAAEVVPSNVTEEELSTGPVAAHVDDVVGHYHGMLRAYEPRPSAPDNKLSVSRQSVEPEPQPTLSTNEYHASDDKVSHVDDVAGHYYGMLKEYKASTSENQGDREIAEPRSEAVGPVDNKALEDPEKSSKVYEPATEIAQPIKEPEDDFLAQYAKDRVAVRHPEELVEIPAVEEQMEDVEPAEDDTYPILSKKSKKDKKKKRQSTFDDFDTTQTTSADDFTMPTTATGAAAAVVANAAFESPKDITEPSAATEEESFYTPIKKSKKDKKKKRQSTFEDFDAPDGAQAAVEEQKEVVEDTAKIQTPDLVESTSQQDVAESSAPPGDESFALGTKKSKKDKKKRQSTFDDLQPSEEPRVATEESKELFEEPEEEQPQEVERDSQRNVVESAEPVEDEFPGFSTKKSKKDKKKKRQSTFDELDTAQTASTDDFVSPKDQSVAESIPEIQKDVFEPSQAIEEEQFVTNTKKSKKDKKKKKTTLSWADDEENVESISQPTGSSTPAEFNEAREVQREGSDAPTVTTGEDMVTRSEAKPVSASIVAAKTASYDDGSAMRHERRQSRSVPGGWDMDEESMDVDRFESAREVDPEVVPEAPKEAVGEEDFGFPTKKTKKDKKGKKSRKVADEEFAEPTREVEEPQIVEPAELVEESQFIEEPTTKEVAQEEEWAFSTKKSKKDKKGKKARDESFPEPESMREVEEVPAVSPGRQSSKETLDDEDFGFSTKKSKKDKKGKKGKRDSVRDITEGEQGAAVLLPTQNPVHVDDVVGRYYGMLRDYKPAPSAPDNKAIDSARNISLEPEHVDDITGHYYGMLRDYQPATGAPDNKSATSTRNIEPTAPEERAQSPVSDEDSRRARRKNRRPSPVYSGEEPDDLPGRRAHTPPAEHDEMMDTALGVAAGLGLTGAAAGAMSEQSHLQGQRGIDESHSTAGSGGTAGWSFGKLPKPNNSTQRDSGIQFTDSPTLPQEQYGAHDRDSGYVQSPANRTSWQESTRGADMEERTNRPPRPQSLTSSSEDIRSKRRSCDLEETPGRKPSPIVSTSKDRSSKLFDSSLSNRTDVLGATSQLDNTHFPHPTTDIHRSPSIHGHHRSREELRSQNPNQPQELESRHATESHREQAASPEPRRSIFGPYPTQEGHERGFSPPKTPLHTIHEQSQDTSSSLRRQREVSDVGSPDRHRSLQHQPSGGNLREVAGIAGAAAIGGVAANGLSKVSRDERAKSLGRNKGRTTSSRSVRQSAQFDPDSVPSSSTHDHSQDKGKGVARDMADVYDGYGEFPGSPMSPTRPPSVRKRQSMQQIKDLESRVDQLASENRLLAEAKINAERHLNDYHLGNSNAGHTSQEAVESANVQLREKDEEIQKLREGVEWMKQELARLTEANDGLSTAHENLRSEHEQLGDQHADVHQSWQESSRDLDTLQSQHNQLSTGMEDIVRHEIDTALAEKNAEIERLHGDLEVAKEKIQELQEQILATNAEDVINARDEDYFESACQSLCQHVQQWVLRFSKFSDTLVCRTTNQVRDEKIVDRFDNAILDGSDVDVYLGDRVKRRDVFMSVVMTMIWEYIFTRYLFGMDREQRQKLKQLEKNLVEVGSPSAVHHWRAMTLTLLSKRDAFKIQREDDTEAVVNEIYDNLSRFLPPTQNLQKQVRDSLRNVLRTAVDLSIEMRTQRAEYIMLPPLQPEYDPNTGDLARKVYFNASLMNERSGETNSNDELEEQQAVVRMVLFPLVVKKGTDSGEGDEEIVVCPAQVLVARPDRKKNARVVSGQSDRMSIDQLSQRNASRHSLAPSTMDMGNVI